MGSASVHTGAGLSNQSVRPARCAKQRNGSERTTAMALPQVCLNRLLWSFSHLRSVGIRAVPTSGGCEPGANAPDVARAAGIGLTPPTCQSPGPGVDGMTVYSCVEPHPLPANPPRQFWQGENTGDAPTSTQEPNGSTNGNRTCQEAVQSGPALSKSIKTREVCMSRCTGKPSQVSDVPARCQRGVLRVKRQPDRAPHSPIVRTAGCTAARRNAPRSTPPARRRSTPSPARRPRRGPRRAARASIAEASAARSRKPREAVVAIAAHPTRQRARRFAQGPRHGAVAQAVLHQQDGVQPPAIALGG